MFCIHIIKHELYERRNTCEKTPIKEDIVALIRSCGGKGCRDAKGNYGRGELHADRIAIINATDIGVVREALSKIHDINKLRRQNRTLLDEVYIQNNSPIKQEIITLIRSCGGKANGYDENGNDVGKGFGDLHEGPYITILRATNLSVVREALTKIHEINKIGIKIGIKMFPHGAMTLYELWSKFNETNLCKDIIKNKLMYYSDSTDVANNDGDNNKNGFNSDEEGYIHISIIDLNRTRPKTETLMRFQIGQTDKWQALEQLSQDLNIDKSEMMAFGNDFNDIGMFSYCGFSYCSDDGHPKALKTSKSTMPDVEHDGVAIVLEKILEMIENKKKSKL